MKIQITVKNVYGNELIYPVCEKAKAFCELTNKKTFSCNDISKIKQLGFEVECVSVIENKGLNDFLKGGVK